MPLSESSKLMGVIEREPQSDNSSLLSISPAATSPILSFSVAAALLALLYLPRFLALFLLSPVTLSALALLTALLRHGANSVRPSYTSQLPVQCMPEEAATDNPFPESYLKLEFLDQSSQNPTKSDHTNGNEPDHAEGPKLDHYEFGVEDFYESTRDMDPGEIEKQVDEVDHLQLTLFRHNLFDRSLRDPLEVIYEEYGEGEDGELEVEMEDFQVNSTEQSKSPVKCEPSRDDEWRSKTEVDQYMLDQFGFTSSDDSSSDSGGCSPVVAWWDFPDDQCFNSEAEGSDDDGMIEIPLEEDNLIELDLTLFR